MSISAHPSITQHCTYHIKHWRQVRSETDVCIFCLAYVPGITRCPLCESAACVACLIKVQEVENREAQMRNWLHEHHALAELDDDQAQERSRKSKGKEKAKFWMKNSISGVAGKQRRGRRKSCDALLYLAVFWPASFIYSATKWPT